MAEAPGAPAPGRAPTAEPFVPPPYPYDRLAPLHGIAGTHPGGAVDCSVGTPTDPTPPSVLDALVSADARGYPPSVGTAAFADAAVSWLDGFLGAAVAPAQVGACIGTKELVAGLPQWLRLRRPDRDTVLFPAVSYPTYAMGARLAGCRAVPVPVTDSWTLDLGAVDPADAARALCLWVNAPGNPAGGLDDLASVVEWSRRRGVLCCSDECYVAFTWASAPHTALAQGTEGVLAVHSLSKRSNFAGGRGGFYAGDADVVGYLREVRKHAGLMVPAPVQAAAVAALSDEDHVTTQRDLYRHRLERMIGQLARLGVRAAMPGGGFYLWVAAPGGDGWSLARRLAEQVGLVVSPGELYGPAGAGHVRIAAVRDGPQLDLVDERLGRAVPG